MSPITLLHVNTQTTNLSLYSQHNPKRQLRIGILAKYHDHAFYYVHIPAQDGHQLQVQREDRVPY